MISPDEFRRVQNIERNSCPVGQRELPIRYPVGRRVDLKSTFLQKLNGIEFFDSEERICIFRTTEFGSFDRKASDLDGAKSFLRKSTEKFCSR
jgi:hypothetical protein